MVYFKHPKGTWCSWLSHPLSILLCLRGVPGSIPGVSIAFLDSIMAVTLDSSIDCGKVA